MINELDTGGWRISQFMNIDKNLPLKPLTLITGGAITGKTTILETISMTDETHRTIWYLAANREPMRHERYGFLHSIQDLPHIGTFGSAEYVGQILAYFGDQEIANPISHPKAKNRTLKENVRMWMREFIPGVIITASMEGEYNSYLDFNVYLDNLSRDSLVNPSYGAFGHVFPIVVTGLVAKPGMTLLIENPELFLTGQAQSYMGDFLAELATAGVQVIVETQSELILSGISLWVANDFFNPKDLGIYFLNREKDTKTEVTAIRMDRYGRLDQEPDGFFDQRAIDLCELLRVQT